MSPTALFTWAMSVSSHGTCAPAPVPAAYPVSLPPSRCTCTTLASPPCLALPPSRSPCQRISPEAGTLRGKPEKALSFEMLVARLPRVPSVEVRSSYQVRAEGGKEGGRARGREKKSLFETVLHNGPTTEAYLRRADPLEEDDDMDRRYRTYTQSQMSLHILLPT